MKIFRSVQVYVFVIPFFLWWTQYFGGNTHLYFFISLLIKKTCISHRIFSKTGGKAFSLIFFFTFYLILEYSHLTALWEFQVDSKGTQPYIHMYPFSPKFASHPCCHITLSRVPCIYSRTLLVWIQFFFFFLDTNFL